MSGVQRPAIIPGSLGYAPRSFGSTQAWRSGWSEFEIRSLLS